MKNYLILLSLIFLVFLAGCIGQTPTAAPGVQTGVIIKSFRPDISEVFSGDSITFSLSVENVGGEDATNVNAKLFGLGTDWIITTRNYSISDLLQKSQPEYKIPGGTGDASWDVQSPSNLKVDNTYTAGVRVMYTYETTALGNFKVYTQDYLRTRPEQAEQIMKSSGISSLVVTKAPVIISFAGVARPIIYRSLGQKMAVTVQLSDVGPGNPYWGSDLANMKVRVDKIKIRDKTCDGTSDCKCSDWTSFPQEVKLPRTGEKSISCTYTFSEAIEDFTTIPINVELTYNYFVESSSTIKVLKTQV